MNHAALLKNGVFYLFIVCVVLFLSSLGPAVSYLIIIGASLVYMAVSGIGLRPGRPLPGAFVGLLSISAAFALILLLGQASVTGVSSIVADAVVLGAAIQLLVSCGEELCFRQALFADLGRASSRRTAAALSSAGFAALHLPAMIALQIDLLPMAVALATIFAAGVLLSLLYVYNGILSAIAFHFVWNFTQYHVFGLGLRSEVPSIVSLAESGSPLFTGGAFGPEASLPGLAVMLFTLGVVWYLYRDKADKSLASRG